MYKKKIERDQKSINIERRIFLKQSALLSGMIALGGGSYLFSPRSAYAAKPIKIGLAMDVTGPYAFGGVPNANTAKLAINEINAEGGILGRPVQLILGDTASNEASGVAKVRQLVQKDRVHMVTGGLLSSMRNAIKDVIIKRGKLIYLYPQLYEGGECTPYLYCTGAVPPQQCDALIPYVLKNGGKKWFMPGADYLWPHSLFGYARPLIEKLGGEVVGEEYYPMDQIEFGPAIQKIKSNKVDVVFLGLVPPSVQAFLKQLHDSGFQKRGGVIASAGYDETFTQIAEPHELEGMVCCLDYLKGIPDPFSTELSAKYDKTYPGGTMFSSGSASTGMYRGLKLWANAVREAGSLERAKVNKALDHAKLDQSGGGQCEFVPGERHLRMSIYLGKYNGKGFDLIDTIEQAEPKQCQS